MRAAGVRGQLKRMIEHDVSHVGEPRDRFGRLNNGQTGADRLNGVGNGPALRAGAAA